MGPALEYISNMGQTILNLARQFTFKDAVDVAIVTVLLYGVIKLVRETRAGQLVKGIILLVVLFLISSLTSPTPHTPSCIVAFISVS